MVVFKKGIWKNLRNRGCLRHPKEPHFSYCAAYLCHHGNLEQWVPIESVSKMLGHKNLRTTQHYAKILDNKVSADIKALKDKLAGWEE